MCWFEICDYYARRFYLDEIERFVDMIKLKDLGLRNGHVIVQGIRPSTSGQSPPGTLDGNGVAKGILFYRSFGR